MMLTMETCDLETESAEFEMMLMGMSRLLDGARYVSNVETSEGEFVCYLVCDENKKLLRVLVHAEEIQKRSGSLLYAVEIHKAQ
jgi:hypothetical protein